MHSQSTNLQVTSHLQSANEVVEAAKALAGALASSPTKAREAEVVSATRALAKAASRLEEVPSPTLGFSPGHAGTPERLPIAIDDALTVAASDAMVAQILFAASKTLGEQEEPAGPTPLREALQSADQTVAEAGAMRFADTSRFTAVDLQQATQDFRVEANAALETVLEQADQAVRKVFHSLQGGKDKILDAFAHAAELWDGGSPLAELLSAAWDRVLAALQTLRRIVALVPVQEALDHLGELIQPLSVRGTLEKIFGSPSLRAELNALDPPSEFDPGEVNRRSQELASLEEHFTKMIANIRRVVDVVAVITPLLTLHFAVEPYSALAVPAAYSLAIVAIVLLGSDFTGAGRLNGGRGIVRIVQELEPSAQTAAE